MPAITYRRKITGDRTTQPYIPYPDQWNAEYSTNKDGQGMGQGTKLYS